MHNEIRLQFTCLRDIPSFIKLLMFFPRDMNLFRQSFNPFLWKLCATVSPWPHSNSQLRINLDWTIYGSYPHWTLFLLLLLIVICGRGGTRAILTCTESIENTVTFKTISFEWLFPVPLIYSRCHSAYIFRSVFTLSAHTHSHQSGECCWRLLPLIARIRRRLCWVCVCVFVSSAYPSDECDYFIIYAFSE